MELTTLDKNKAKRGLNAIETQLEIACDYELKGEKEKSKKHLCLALWFDALAHGANPDKMLESDND